MTDGQITQVLSTAETRLIDLSRQRRADLTPWFDEHRAKLALLGRLLGSLVAAQPADEPQVVLSRARNLVEQKLSTQSTWFSKNEPLLLYLTKQLVAAAGEAALPPVVAAPTFAIRKPAVAVFTLDDYAAAGIMTMGEAGALRQAVADRRNILVAGGTSTGKTTLANALLAEVAKTADRVVLIEDTRELQCRAANLVALRTKDGVASLSDLVRSSLRLRPDRIPIGEVRGAEALDLLKAWGTGHPGGIGTIHAGTARGALRRLEQLIQEAVVTVPRALIAETIDLIAVLSGRGVARRLTELARVDGLGTDSDYALSLAGDHQ
mgnify:CR=1 FL=1